MEKRTYSFIKNCAGTLSIPLDSFDMSIPEKVFIIPYNVEKIVVPYKFALGLFVSRDALDQYKMGYFTIEDGDKLIQDAIERGLYAAEDRPDIFTKTAIQKAIKSSDMATIKKILDSKNAVSVDTLLIVARENIDTLTTGAVDIIEKSCGVELRIE